MIRSQVSGGKSLGLPSSHPPRDDEIKAWRVYVVGADGRLGDLQILNEVLASRVLDTKGKPTQFLQEVVPADVNRPYPVCKLYDKKAAREAEEAKRKAAKMTKIQTKQLEVSWGMSDNDLGHRIVRLKEFLKKGWKVEVVFGSKRKGWMNKREASAEEAERVLQKLREAVNEVEGAKEWREMQGFLGGEGILSFEGKLMR